jgi:hypothetical protein
MKIGSGTAWLALIILLPLSLSVLVAIGEDRGCMKIGSSTALLKPS